MSFSNNPHIHPSNNTDAYRIPLIPYSDENDISLNHQGQVDRWEESQIYNFNSRNPCSLNTKISCPFEQLKNHLINDVF